MDEFYFFAVIIIFVAFFFTISHLLNPDSCKILINFFGPACAPSANPFFCDLDVGIHPIVENDGLNASFELYWDGGY